MIAKVILAIPYSYPYEYKIPDSLLDRITQGSRVLVPFGLASRIMIGTVVEIKEHSEYARLKTIEQLIDPEVIITAEMLTFTRWLSNYYLCSWGEVLDAALPAGLKPKIDKLVRIDRKSLTKQNLPNHQKEWIESIDGKKFSVVSQTEKFQQYLTFFKKIQKEKTVRFQYKLSEILHSTQKEEWIVLNEEWLKNRQRTKPEQILELLKNRETIPLKELKEAIPNATAAISNMVKKGELIKEIKAPDNPETPKKMEEWISVDKDSLKKKKRSKTDKVLELMQLRKEIRAFELKQELPNAAPTINNLIKKSILIRQEREPKLSPEQKKIEHDKFFILNEEQEVAVQKIRESIIKEEYRTFLLHGVTGSGKTEVFLNAVRDTIKRGKTALILIPEISLTPQAVNRFRERFGDQIAVLHSGMGDRERANEWWKIKEQKCTIVIGARSAIFAPLENIGLIVIDEEHDSSYKQQETPYYNARDASIKIASDRKAVVILASATPSIVSFNNAQNGKYTLLTLSKRANQKAMPQSEVINLRTEQRQKGVFYLSKSIINQLKENFLQKKQAIIFLNRRGYAAFLSCKACEQPVICQNCSIAMTWHQKHRSLICHHCGYKEPYPNHCEACDEKSFQTEGIGTQRVERDLKLLFPNGRFLRMDRDTIQKKGVLEKNIEQIANGEVDFIIGTQLISKGHDFQNIGLVSIILADMTLNIPDYRSSERTFQLLSQVSGRAGRGEDGEGKTIIQTYNPNHYSIRTALAHDYYEFHQEELINRQILNHPPNTREILIKLSDTNPNSVQYTAEKLGSILHGHCKEYQFEVFGPVESSIAKINNRYYWEILLKIPQIGKNKQLLHHLLWNQKNWGPKGTTRITINVDP